MPPAKRKPATAASGPAESPAVASPTTPRGQVYRYEQLIHVPADSPDLPGPDSAAVTAAINAGFRPNGEACVESTEDRGSMTLVVWAVPVEAA